MKATESWKGRGRIVLFCLYLAPLVVVGLWGVGVFARDAGAEASPLENPQWSPVSAGLVARPSVPDLQAQIDRVVYAVDQHTEVGLGRDQIEQPPEVTAWDSLMVTQNDLGKAAALFPTEISFRKMLRNRRLNPGDVEIPYEVWSEEEKRVAPLLKRIRDMGFIEQRAAEEEMKSAVGMGLAKGQALVSRDVGDVREFSVSTSQMKSRARVYSVHSVGGQSYVFSINELPQTFQSVQVREILVSDYLSQVAEFMCRAGVSSSAQGIPLLESFYTNSWTMR